MQCVTALNFYYPGLRGGASFSHDSSESFWNNACEITTASQLLKVESCSFEERFARRENAHVVCIVLPRHVYTVFIARKARIYVCACVYVCTDRKARNGGAEGSNGTTTAPIYASIIFNLVSIYRSNVSSKVWSAVSAEELGQNSWDTAWILFPSRFNRFLRKNRMCVYTNRHWMFYRASVCWV